MPAQRLRDLEPLFIDAELRWNRFAAERDAGAQKAGAEESGGPLTQYLLLSDWRAVAAALDTLRDRADNFLELGSGIGAVTIAADRLGYRAVGIELEPDLVLGAEALARDFGSRATFAEGSYLPSDYAAGADVLDGGFEAIGEGEPAWGELGESLDDFDLVFCYPWPGDEGLVLDLMQRCGHVQALLLLYRTGEGVELYREGERLPLPGERAGAPTRSSRSPHGGGAES